MITRLSALVVAALLVFGMTGCGDDDAGTADAERTKSVEVVATDLKLSAKTYDAPAGEVEIKYRNDGKVEHTLVIEGVDGFKLDVPKNGDVDQATATLDVGFYTMYCDIPGHRAAGMEATLDVS